MSSFFPGAEMMTRLAPPFVMCTSALALSVKKPVASITMSAPTLFHEIDPGSLSEKHGWACPRSPIGFHLLRLWLARCPERIVFQEMGQGLAVRQVVDRNNLEIASTQSGAQNIPTDSSESVDTDFDHL
jgi:hypothetical protein